MLTIEHFAIANALFCRITRKLGIDIPPPDLPTNLELSRLSLWIDYSEKSRRYNLWE